MEANWTIETSDIWNIIKLVDSYSRTLTY